MSWTKQTTIWCDSGAADGCYGHTTVDTNRVEAAREEAERLERWDCGRDDTFHTDLCPPCRKVEDDG